MTDNPAYPRLRLAYADLLPFMHKGERAYADALGCGWMTNREARQAVPPAYTEWIGRRLMALSPQFGSSPGDTAAVTEPTRYGVSNPACRYSAAQPSISSFALSASSASTNSSTLHHDTKREATR